MKRLGLQLYSIKDETEKDFPSAIKKVADTGFDTVEFAGYFGLSAHDMKELLSANGLTALSSHVGLERLEADLQGEMDYLNYLGAPYLIVPHAPMATEKEAAEMAAKLNGYGRACKENGLRLGYHNHAHELKSEGGKIFLDVLLENTDPELVNLQIDLYFFALMGMDSLAYIKAHKDRVMLLHLKELESAGSKKNAPIGRGIVDFPAVLAECPDLDAFVEQEDIEQECWSALREGVVYLRRIIV